LIKLDIEDDVLPYCKKENIGMMELEMIESFCEKF